MLRKNFLLAGLTGLVPMQLFGGLLQASKNKYNDLKPFYIPPDEETLEVAQGLDIRVKIRSHQTNMQFSCVDFAVAPRTMGPAPHIHEALDELMYVHKGTVSVMVDNVVTEIKAGGWHFRPRGIVHTFWNAGEDPVLATDMYFNQNFEDFLEELFHKIFPEMRQRSLTPDHPEISLKLADLDRRFGVTTFPGQRQPIIDKYNLRG